MIRDLTDGYFPSELQSRYPEGVPLAVSDQRDMFYTHKSTANYFPGSGKTLGGDRGPSRLIPAGSELRAVPTGLKETSALPGEKVSVDQFLTKLPASVVKGGRVLSIRSDIRDRLVSDVKVTAAVHDDAVSFNAIFFLWAEFGQWNEYAASGN